MDLYVRDFVPQAFLAVNESPATVVPPPTLVEIDFASYIASFAGSRFLSTLPQPPEHQYSGAISLQSTASLNSGTYEFFFEECLSLEVDAYAATLEEYKLYGTSLDLLENRHIPVFRLKLPGLRDGTPVIALGDHVLLRQLVLDPLSKLPRNMDSWLRPGGGRDRGLLAPGFVGAEVIATVYTVDKANETILLQATGLLLNLPLTCNVGFVRPKRWSQSMQRAILSAAKGLRLGNQQWVRQMLFPAESDGIVQTELPSVVFDIEWDDETLNYEQKKAVNSVVKRSYGGMPFLLYGPPGSGKTKTVCEIVAQLAKNPNFKGSILLCAPSNPAADILAERLSKTLSPQEMFRLNDCSRTFAEVPNSLLAYCFVQNETFNLPPLPNLLRKKVVISTCRDADILVRARITNSDIASLQYKVSEMLYPFHGPQVTVPCHWLALMIDEAAQATEPETAIPLMVVAPQPIFTGSLEPAFVMAGDEHQLSPRTYERSTTLHVSLFERLSRSPLYSCHPLARKNAAHDSRVPMIRPPFVNLTRNYRSHPAILAMPSLLFYANTLIPEATERDGLLDWSGWQGRRWPILFTCNGGMDICEDLRNSGTGWYNVSEVEKALFYAENLLESQLITDPVNLCIMSPFPAQVRRLRTAARERGLHDINIGPMEAFQGLESQVVIICTTRTRKRFLKDDDTKAMGIIGNEKKFNVAITRAKEGLIVIGNPWTMSTNVYWDAFLRFCYRNGLWEADTRVDRGNQDLTEPNPNDWAPTKRDDPEEELKACSIASLEAALVFEENHRQGASRQQRRLGGQSADDSVWQSGLDAEQIIGPQDQDDVSVSESIDLADNEASKE